MKNKTWAANFLGCGISFPPRVDEVTGRIRMSSQEDDIREAIRIILFTGKGERVMQPEFGCQIRKYAFSSMGMIDRTGMEEEVRQALIRWEPRITDTEVKVDDGRAEQGMVEIHISYAVRATNNPYNLVFPYYINEGM